MSDLLARANEIRAHLKSLEERPHDEKRGIVNPYHEYYEGSPQRQGLERHSTRPVLFHRRRDAVLAGPDAERCAAALKQFHEDGQPHLVPGDPKLTDADFAPAVRVWEDCTLTGAGDAAVLSIPLDVVNAALKALTDSGILLTQG